MHVVQSINECVSIRKQTKGRVGFVPTMGALHAGHLELVKCSLKNCDITIVSIFFNPKQFAENEDLDNYPENIKQDLKLLKNLNVDYVFTPQKSEMYLDTHSMYLIENKLSQRLEGVSRPNFFQGVITIVAKLFNICQPTDVFFGEKDAQQLIIIKKLIKDLNYNIICHAVPTVRNKKGLALSSRNEYLNKSQLDIASNIYKSLCLVQIKISEGEKDAAVLKKLFKKTIDSFPELTIDYFSIADINTLEEITHQIQSTVLISTAIFLDGVRLIDNIKYTI